MNCIKLLFFGAILVISGCGARTETVYKNSKTVTVTKTVVHNNVATEKAPVGCESDREEEGGGYQSTFPTLAMAPGHWRNRALEGFNVDEVLILCNGKIYRVKVK